MELSKTFYYKALANNRALLTLAVDRAEDEVFKAALLAYTFVLMENKVRGNEINLFLNLNMTKPFPFTFCSIFHI